MADLACWRSERWARLRLSGGALAEAVLPQITYYRCHVGHQFGLQSLAAAQTESAEGKLWASEATLEETAALARNLAGRNSTRRSRR